MQTKLAPNNRPHIYKALGTWQVKAFNSVNYEAMQHALRWCYVMNQEIAHANHRAAMIEAGYMVEGKRIYNEALHRFAHRREV